MDAIRQLVIRLLAKNTKSGIVTTLPKKNILDFQTMILAEKFMQNGVDPRMFKNADQAENMLKQIDEADKARASGITETQSAKVFNIEGQKLDPNKPIIGGTQTGKELSPELSDRLRGTEVERIKQKIADKKIDDDLPPPGSRGGEDDIAAPFQSQEETLKNMIVAENKKNIAAMKQRRMLDEAIDDASPGFSGDRKVDAELVAENLAERMGLVYDDMPTKERLKLYDQALTGLSKKKLPPEDMATGGRAGFKTGLGKKFLELLKGKKNKLKGDKIYGVGGKEIDVADLKKSLGLDEATQKKDMEDLEKKLQMIIGRDRTKHAIGGRAGYKFGIGPLIELLTKASKTSPLQFGKNYMKNVKEKTLKANETGKFSDLPIAEAGLPAATGAFITNQVKKRLQSMNEEERQKNKDEMFKEISQEYKEMYKDDPEFLEKMLLSLHENIYMDKKAEGGRIGYKDGPKFDIQASGTKSGKQQIQGAPEGFTIDKETFNAILKADIPLSEKIDFLASYQYGKGRDRIEKDNQEIFLGEGGYKDRNVGFGFNKEGEGIGGTLMYNMETGEPEFNIKFKKSFEDGGRVGLKSGSLKKFLERRNFLKTIVGNSPEAESRRTLQKILDEQKEFKKFLDKNPPVKFPAPGDKEYDDYILRLNQIMAKDRLKSATGGRIGYKVGGFDKARRAFLKMLGLGAGATAAAKSGILRFSDTAVPKVIEKVPINSSTTSVPPPYFFELAEKIKKLGKPDKVTYQERVEITRYTGKNGDEYELIEDLTTGDMQITKDKTGVGTYGDKSFDTIEDRTVLEYRKGDADVDIETQRGYRSADEYEEYKVEFDPDGTPADATDMDAIVQKEIIEEAQGDAPSIKKAGGGIARMLGE